MMMTRINWRAIACIAALTITFSPLYAQFRMNRGDDSPLNKLHYAEIAINNLYVDSVDEQKLVEDAIRGML